MWPRLVVLMWFRKLWFLRILTQKVFGTFNGNIWPCYKKFRGKGVRTCKNSRLNTIGWKESKSVKMHDSRGLILDAWQVWTHLMLDRRTILNRATYHCVIPDDLARDTCLLVSRPAFTKFQKFHIVLTRLVLDWVEAGFSQLFLEFQPKIFLKCSILGDWVHP